MTRMGSVSEGGYASANRGTIILLLFWGGACYFHYLLLFTFILFKKIGLLFTIIGYWFLLLFLLFMYNYLQLRGQVEDIF